MLMMPLLSISLTSADLNRFGEQALALQTRTQERRTTMRASVAAAALVAHLMLRVGSAKNITAYVGNPKLNSLRGSLAAVGRISLKVCAATQVEGCNAGIEEEACQMRAGQQTGRLMTKLQRLEL